MLNKGHGRIVFYPPGRRSQPVLPWYPVKSMDETRKFYEERYASKDGLPYITATHDRNRLSILSSRTYPIHVVKRNGNEWNNYINFRDYLNVFLEEARLWRAGQ